MSDRQYLLLGVLILLLGFGMLARLDVPLISHGGLAAGAAGLELGVATLVVSIALGAAARQW